MSAVSVSAAEAEAPLILTIDIGSSSTRAMLYDRRARPVRGVAAQQAYRFSVDQDGQAEDDPHLACARVADCIDALLAQAGTLADQIGAVALATMAGTLIGLDAADRPLTGVLTYADTRASGAAELLRTTLHEPSVHQRTGCLLRSSYWPAQLTMLRFREAALTARVEHWVTLGDYVERQLFGRGRVSLSAAAWTGLLNRQTLDWDDELIDQIGLQRSRLSRLVDIDEPISGLSAEYAARWPTLATLPWLPAVGDGAAANIGSGCSQPGRMALTVGTSGALRIVQPTPPHIPDGLWCYRVDRSAALLGGATSEGGNLHAWLRRTTQLGDAATVEAELAAMAPDSHGLTVLPFIAGERSPGWAGNVPATIHGIRVSTSALDILRACLEAIALRFALIAARLRSSTTPIELVVASGGALLSSPAWLQLCADALELPLAALAEPESTTRGAAILALRTLGVIPDLAQIEPQFGQTYYPDAQRAAIYRRAGERQQWFYDRLITAAATGR